MNPIRSLTELFSLVLKQFLLDMSMSFVLFFRFNELILQDIQWLVLAPFVAMVIILLVSHGFPAKDLLPITFPVKKK